MANWTKIEKLTSKPNVGYEDIIQIRHSFYELFKARLERFRVYDEVEYYYDKGLYPRVTIISDQDDEFVVWSDPDGKLNNLRIEALQLRRVKQSPLTLFHIALNGQRIPTGTPLREYRGCKEENTSLQLEIVAAPNELPEVYTWILDILYSIECDNDEFMPDTPHSCIEIEPNRFWTDEAISVHSRVFKFSSSFSSGVKSTSNHNN
ncbi:MAG: hypothetical protein GY854_01525 [Deltaproteobacteria bacterium]|nr:hypothetical protein [Deltaproteobacteria bacterium]